MKKFLRTYTLALFILISAQNCDILNPDSGSSRKDDNLILLALALQSNACNVGRDGFWSIDFSTGRDICVRVEKKVEGRRAILYEERGLSRIRQFNGIPDPNYASFLNQVDQNIVPKLTNAFAAPSDVNGDGKVAIVILNLSRFSSGGGFIAGYFSPLDLFRSGSGLRSNSREVIFVDGVSLADIAARSVSRGNPNDMLSTIAHELQHLIRFPYIIGQPNPTSPYSLPRTQAELNNFLRTDSLWINEGSSEVASDIAGFGPQSSRIGCLRGDPAIGCQNFLNGRSLYRFTNSILDYSLSYAFMKYLYENSGDTLAERNTFMRASIQGSTRANNVNNLMQVYRTRAAKYNTTNLDLPGNPSNEQVFSRLGAGFFAGLYGYPNAGSTTARFGLAGSTAINTTILTHYPMPNEIAEILALPGAQPLVTNNPTAFELEAGQIYRVQGTAPGGIGPDAIVHLVQRGDGSNEYTIFNGSMDEDRKEGFTAVSTSLLGKSAMGMSQTEVLRRFRANPNLSLNLPEVSERVGVGVDDYIWKRSLWTLLNSPGLITDL
jgi:hypothetical protein